SRRRHTRSKRDWSSDVCSSDLLRLEQRGRPAAEEDRGEADAPRPRQLGEQVELAGQRFQITGEQALVERRRVEAAVMAALRAEGDMDVETELGRARLRSGQHYGM